MNDALRTALTRLRLSGLASTLDVRLQEAAGNRLGHAEFLELVLQDELLIRNDQLIGRRTKAAGFREHKTLEDFDWQFNPSIKKKLIFDLVRDFLSDEALGGHRHQRPQLPAQRSCRKIHNAKCARQQERAGLHRRGEMNIMHKTGRF